MSENKFFGMDGMGYLRSEIGRISGGCFLSYPSKLRRMISWSRNIIAAVNISRHKIHITLFLNLMIHKDRLRQRLFIPYIFCENPSITFKLVFGSILILGGVRWKSTNSLSCMFSVFYMKWHTMKCSTPVINLVIFIP